MSSKDSNRKPLVSIITPAYNSESFIHETIQSVLVQTYDHWEMIIVDDCSTDKTVEIIKTYIEKDNKITLIQLEKNSGAAMARNTAMVHAKGTYLAFLDSDDMWLPEKLEKQLHFMETKEIAFSFTKYILIDAVGKEMNESEKIPDVVTYDDLLKQNMIGCLTVMLDRSKIGDVSMVNIRSRQDYVLWLSLCKQGFQPHGMQEVLAKYRVVKNSLSSNKIKMAKQNWKVYREIERLSLVKSIKYFMFYIYNKFKKYK